MIEPVRFRFVTATGREAEKVARDVKRQISRVAAAEQLDPPEMNLEADESHQDAGSILAVVLAGPAVIAIMKVFAEWVCDRGFIVEMTLPSGAKIRLENADRDLVEKTIRTHAAR